MNLQNRYFWWKKLNKTLPKKIIYQFSHYKMHFQYGNHKYIANLKNPKTFNEKIIWLKLNYRNKLIPNLTDKYSVRKFVKDTIGEGYLIPLIGVYDSPNEIQFNDLPANCVIKPSNGSGWVLFFDRRNLNKDTIDKIREQLLEWLSIDTSILFGEWNYKIRQPKIIIEKLLGELGDIVDYKFFCFNGEPKYIQVDLDRHTQHKRSFMDTTWRQTPFQLKYPKPQKQVSKPTNLEEMLEIAKILSNGFPFVRVDLYNINNKVFFGELTFHPESGNGPFESYEQDLLFGELLKIECKHLH